MSEEEIKEIKRKINALDQREENRFLMFERKVATLNGLNDQNLKNDLGIHKNQYDRIKKLEEQMEIKTDVIHDLLKRTGYIPSILVMNEINGRLEKLETQIKKYVDFDLYKVDIDFDLGQHIKLNDDIAENRIVLKALIATEIAHYTEMIIQLQKLEPDHFQIKDLKKRIEDWKQLGKRLSHGKTVDCDVELKDSIRTSEKKELESVQLATQKSGYIESFHTVPKEKDAGPACKNCGKELLKIENKFECKNCGWRYNSDLKHISKIYPNYPTYEELRDIAQPIFEKFDRADLIKFTNKFKEMK